MTKLLIIPVMLAYFVGCEGEVIEPSEETSKTDQLEESFVLPDNSADYYPDGDIMDNGRYDRKDVITWDFRWPETEDAAKYQLYVKNRDAINPVIDQVVYENKFTFTGEGSYIVNRNRFNWEW